MNGGNHALARLLKAARQSQHEPASSPSFALESKILAQLRSANTQDELASLAVLFRRAAVYAALVMILTLGWSRIVSVNDVPGGTALETLASAMRVVP